MDRYLLEAKTGTKIPRKTVHLVRHGQSIHNAHSLMSDGADLNDPRYVDAPLTQLGTQQALDIIPALTGLDPELVVTSPFTRATQTCLHATRELRVPVVVNQLCGERLAYACDIGSPVPVLQKRFPSLDYGDVRPRDAWWWKKGDGQGSVEKSLEMLRRHAPGAYKDVEPTAVFRKRVNDFRLWLLRRPETKIVVFAHGVFNTSLLADGSHMKNCEIRKLVL